jgi:hypothetical protein
MKSDTWHAKHALRMPPTERFSPSREGCGKSGIKNDLDIPGKWLLTRLSHESRHECSLHERGDSAGDENDTCPLTTVPSNAGKSGGEGQREQELRVDSCRAMTRLAARIWSTFAIATDTAAPSASGIETLALYPPSMFCRVLRRGTGPWS